MTISHTPNRLTRAGRQPYLDTSGAYIGAAVPLLEKDAAGRWQRDRLRYSSDCFASAIGGRSIWKGG